MQRGSTLVNVQLKYDAGQNPIRRLYVAADARLRRVRDWQAPGLRDSQKRDLPGHPGAFVLNFSRPVTGTFQVEATFSLEGSSGVGTLRLPTLVPLWSQVQRNWLAVSVDSNLEVIDSQGREVPRADFVAAWTGSPPATEIYQAYDQTEAGQDWSLSTRPKAPIKLVDESLIVSIGPVHSELQFEAHIDTRDAPSFRHRLDVPKSVRVRSIRVQEDGGEVAARWSRDSTGELTVFLEGPAGGQQLVLEGTVETQLPSSLAIPQLHVLDAVLGRSRVQVFRRPEVLVRMKDGLAPAEQKAETWGRLVADLDLPVKTGKPIASKVVAQLKRNEPRVRARQVTTLQRSADAWSAMVEFQVLEVRGGLADEIRFEIPEAWNGPFQVTPPMTTRLIEAVGNSRPQLLLRPPGAIDGNLSVKVRSPLRISADSRLSVPRIAPLGLGAVDRFLVLPTQLELQAAAWDVQGVEPAELPEGFESPPPNSFVVYHVRGRRYRARLQSVDTALSSAVAKQSRVHIAWHPDGSYRAVAHFDVDTAGRTQADVLLPPQTRPVWFEVDQVPFSPTRTGNAWKVQFEPTRSIVRLTLVYEGKSLEQTLSGIAFSAPRLRNIPTGEVLWTVAGLPAGTSAPAGTVPQTSAAQDLDHARHLAEVMLQAVSRAGEIPLDQLSDWYALWQPQLKRSAAHIRALAAVTDDPDVHELDANLTTLAAKWSRVLDSSESTTGKLPSLVTQSVAGRWCGEDSLGYSTVRFKSAGKPQVLSLQVPVATRLARAAKWLAVAALMLIAATLTFGWDRRRGLAWLERWSPAMVVLVGLAWWLWLIPSLAGWLLVGWGIWLSMRTRRAPRSERPSTITRVATHGSSR